MFLIGLEAAGARHRYVHYHDVGGVRLECAVGVGGVVGFGDHAEIALVFQDAPVALPDDGMVVDQQDRNAWGLRGSHSPDA